MAAARTAVAEETRSVQPSALAGREGRKIWRSGWQRAVVAEA